MGNITVRPATPEDAVLCGTLIRQAGLMDVHTDKVVGFGDKESSIRIMSEIFKKEENSFSYRFTFVAVYDNKEAGILTLLPGNLVGKLMRKMAGELVRIIGFWKVLKFAFENLPMMRFRSSLKDEYDVQVLSVLPEFQGKGIGGYLLDFADKKALEAGFQKCSLAVDMVNDNARRLYERKGYTVVETFNIKMKKVPTMKGYYRMVKKLT
jgi:ribosomal protein S18 acetylase RimI-like enzyme